MAFILPFRGISYNPQKIKDFGEVVAPPYDVISPQEQEALYQRHPRNVVRLILNKETPRIIRGTTGTPARRLSMRPGRKKKF